tara:strand:+ start:18471 stop:19250 length:780 start_codon:yes stop_codon:yes gene_type:complete
MKTKKKPTELQTSYHAMVDSVEAFVVQEGKSLKQAFKAAEEKLEDASELSKEKIQHASRYLKDNLRFWGETVEGVTDAYKDQIQFDIAYVNNSIWSKLQSIAKTNSAELMEFTRTLKEEAQSVRTAEHLGAHQEHNQWASEHALWLDEIEFWKKDHEQALTKLMEIEKALKQQSTSLFEHAQVIQALANIDHKHEEIMANAEHDPSSEVFKVADEKEIAVHNKERKIHTQHSEFHHAVKTHHFKIMAMINMLDKEMRKV